MNVTNFNNPPSTYPISSIVASLVDSASAQKAIYSTATLSNLSPDVLLTASITPLSDQIGDQSATVKIGLTPKNPLPANGKIVVYFPMWNPSDTFNVQHQIQSSAPTCTNVQGMSATITCTYNVDNNLLTLSNMISSSTSGSLLEFTVNNFLNPYSGVPKTGYYIYTEDYNNGKIDSSQNSITMTVQVSTWASFSQATITRTDGITTVEESTEGSVYFSLVLPVDTDCRLKIVFPTDSPLTSSLTAVSGSGIFDGTTSFATKSISGNYINLDGCSSYATSPS